MMNDEEAGMVEQKADTTMKTQETQRGLGTAQKEPARAQEKRIPPSGKAERHATISWVFCFEDSCPTHLSDKQGSGWFPQRTKRRKTGHQESLCMMTPPPDDMDSEESSEDETVSDGSINEGGYAVIRATSEYIDIVTKYWVREPCTGFNCELGTQHYHIIYNPDAEAREYVRAIRLDACENPGCENGPRPHSHQTGTSIQLPQEELDDIWATHERELPAWAEGQPIRVGYLEDERGDPHYLSEHFECNDTACPNFWTEHEHVRNVDPECPGLDMRPDLAQFMIRQGMTCIDQNCEWKENAHLHWPKNL